MSQVTTHVYVNEELDRTKVTMDADVRMGVENFFDLMWEYVDDHGHGFVKAELRTSGGMLIGWVEPEDGPWAEFDVFLCDEDEDYDGDHLFDAMEVGVYAAFERSNGLDIRIYTEA